MSKFMDDEIDNWMREYFQRLSFYYEIGRNSDILRELEVSGQEQDLVTERHEFNKLDTNHYKKLMGHNGYKVKTQLREDKVITLTGQDVDLAMSQIALDKATSWEMIPGEVLTHLLADKRADVGKYNISCNKIADILNEMIRMEDMPEEIVTARLVCLNKEVYLKGILDNIRSIAVMSLYKKIIEHKLKIMIEEKIENEDIISRD
jgi:hypothetical protein